ncbi:YtxH domain-containing protein [Paenibacillus sp. CAU 1782]
MSKHNSTTSGIITGALVGGAVGVIAALLLAPKSGQELRSDLGQQLQTVGRRAKDLADAVCSSTKETASQAVSNAGEAAASIGQHAKEAAEAVGSGAKEAAEAFSTGTKEAIQDAAEGIKSDIASLPPVNGNSSN